VVSPQFSLIILSTYPRIPHSLIFPLSFFFILWAVVRTLGTCWNGVHWGVDMGNIELDGCMVWDLNWEPLTSGERLNLKLDVKVN